MNLSVVCLIILVCVQSRSSSSILSMIFTSVTLGNASPTLTVPETEDNNSNHLGKLFNVAMNINYNIVHTVGAGIGGAICSTLIIILAFILSVLIMRRQSEFF